MMQSKVPRAEAVENLAARTQRRLGFEEYSFFNSAVSAPKKSTTRSSCRKSKVPRASRPQLFIIVVILLLSYYRPTHAQEYLFSVPRVVLEARIQPEGGALIHYWIHFQNTAAGHAIDIIDIGLPHEQYNIGLMKAWMDGNPLNGPIQQSQYVNPGVEVHAGDRQIPPGGFGSFEFEAPIPDLVFQDTTRDDYASFQITPTFFGSQYVQGSTDLTIRVILPPGVAADEVLYHDVPFTGKESEEGSVIVSWETNRPFTSPYRVGVSFPKRVMQKVVTMSITQLMMRWWRGKFSTETRGWIAFAAAVWLFVVYLRFTGGTGCALFLPVLIAAAFFFLKYDATEIFIWPLLFVLTVIVETARKNRKAKYLPAIASVEGGGIKRGLTAPEAAVLLEFPLNKLITLVLFGMMKKGVIRQTGNDPVVFAVVEPPPIDAVLHDYEKTFLREIKKKNQTPVNKVDFSRPLKSLIDSVAKRMVGFDLDETREYYKHIIARAWREAQEIGDVEVWQKKMDEKVDWMMIDPDFPARFRPYQDRYIPRSYRPVSVATGSAGGTKSSGSQSGTRFSDVAASVSGWFQNTASGAVGTIEGQKGGVLDFGSIDKAINKAMASSGGGSGGGGGCACACAGCACACACAGGGR